MPIVVNVAGLLIFAGVIVGVQAVLRGLGWSDGVAILLGIVAGAIVMTALLLLGLLDETWGKKGRGPEER
jgi:hypothetical protein